GCSDFGSERLLPPAEWCAFASARRSELEGLRWVFLGAANDREASEAVARSLRKIFGGAFAYENRCGELALTKSLAVLAGARRFMGVD
ncbi:MAG TPA: hypothetical protein DEP35_18055, partial [Deltaproteobacteria bacterium]|nr:hypothetical protein [Deltaproteobacteria bacterium]